MIEKDGGVFGRNGRRRTRGQKAAQNRDRHNQLAHSCHLLSRSNCSGSALRGHARLRPWPERLGLRTGWDRALRSHKALGPHAPRRCRSRSSRLVPNSSSLLTQRPRRRSAGPGNSLGTGAADETLRMPKGMLQVSQARVPSSSGVRRCPINLRRGHKGRARRGDNALRMGRRLPSRAVCGALGPLAAQAPNAGRRSGRVPLEEEQGHGREERQ